MNAAGQLLSAWLEGSTKRDYRAPCAPRGTPQRKHDNLRTVGDKLMTRGERKQFMRARAMHLVLAEQALVARVQASFDGAC